MRSCRTQQRELSIAQIWYLILTYKEATSLIPPGMSTRKIYCIHIHSYIVDYEYMNISYSTCRISTVQSVCITIYGIFYINTVTNTFEYTVQVVLFNKYSKKCIPIQYGRFSQIHLILIDLIALNFLYIYVYIHIYIYEAPGKKTLTLSQITYP